MSFIHQVSQTDGTILGVVKGSEGYVLQRVVGTRKFVEDHFDTLTEAREYLGVNVHPRRPAAMSRWDAQYMREQDAKARHASGGKTGDGMKGGKKK